MTTAAGLTQDELRARAVLIAETVEAARAAIERAKADAEALYRDLDRANPGLPRFDYTACVFLRGLAEDLGADIDGDGCGGEFDIDRLSLEARDLVELVDLACTERKELTHA